MQLWEKRLQCLGARSGKEEGSNLVKTLSGTKLFAGLSDEQLALVASLCRQRRYGEGQILLFEGDAYPQVIIVVQGEVTVAIRLFPDSCQRPDTTAVEKLGPGGVIGCCALVDGCQGLTARCTQDAQVVVADACELKALLATHPDIGLIVMENAFRMVSDRLVRARQLLLAQYGLHEMYQTYRNY
jgi:CRP-like cAMP-binding protein